MNLKAPVNIEDLMKEWTEDSVIDSTNVDLELLKIGNLHSKYLNIMSYHRHLARKLDADYRVLKGLREEYFNGYLNNPEDLEKHNWEPMQLKLTNPQIARKLETDGELNKMLLKKVAHEEIVSYCESVIRNLNNRSWDLKSYVDYQKWANPAGR